jgi:hypothetical protein
MYYNTKADDLQVKKIIFLIYFLSVEILKVLWYNVRGGE